jgi:hypothetical protein
MTIRSRGSKRVGEAAEVVAAKLRARVEREVPVLSVLDISDHEHLFLEKDRDALRDQRFDFVLFSSIGRPQLALEFDGPTHAREAKQRADLRKNRACWVAGLPFRRFRPSDAQPHDGTAIVDWVLQRFGAWSTRREESSSQDFGDPSLLFDLRHPFPGTKAKGAYLWRKYGIVSELLDDVEYDQAILGGRRGELEYGGATSRGGEGFSRSYTLTRCLTLRSPNGAVVRQRNFSHTLSYDWCLPLFPGPGSFTPVPIHFDVGVLEQVVNPCNISGSSSDEVVHATTDYYVFIQVCQWLQGNSDWLGVQSNR